MTKQIRDNAYLMKRLESEHPAVFIDWQAGKFKSRREALISVGLKREPKQLNVLKNAWSRANATERAEFRRWIGASSPVPQVPTIATSGQPVTTSTLPSTAVSRALKAPRKNQKVIDSDGYLKPWAKVRIREIMKGRKMTKTGAVMKDLGRVDKGDSQQR